PNKNLIQIFYCDSFGKDKRKPSPFFINHILNKYKLIKKELLFVGNCETDREAALNGGIDYIDISNFMSRIKFQIHN
ncbi:MAG: HAD hydrolase-like protein, partial [Bacteroidetes bacterium]|nr:HAD hydrolase-like protein [Bacteroidota bacterium]